MIQHNLLNIVEICAVTITQLTTVDNDEQNGAVLFLPHSGPRCNSPAILLATNLPFSIHDNTRLKGYRLLYAQLY
ncbi:hypothetical protein D3C80_1930860 [compost metagenome]